MATRTVPEEKWFVCDVCGAEEQTPRSQGKGLRLHGGRLVLKRDALDHHNAPVADASVKRDLCDKCLNIITKAVNAAAERIQNGTTGPIDIVFDGPPGPECGRFVEVEQCGPSISFGTWVEREDGYHVIRFDPIEVK